METATRVITASFIIPGTETLGLGEAQRMSLLPQPLLPVHLTVPHIHTKSGIMGTSLVHVTLLVNVTEVTVANLCTVIYSHGRSTGVRMNGLRVRNQMLRLLLLRARADTDVGNRVLGVGGPMTLGTPVTRGGPADLVGLAGPTGLEGPRALGARAATEAAATATAGSLHLPAPGVPGHPGHPGLRGVALLAGVVSLVGLLALVAPIALPALGKVGTLAAPGVAAVLALAGAHAPGEAQTMTIAREERSRGGVGTGGVRLPPPPSFIWTPIPVLTFR